MAEDDADIVIDLRERLAPYVDMDVDLFAPETDDVPPEPPLTGLTRRVRPLRAPYEPRHLAT